MRKLQLKRNILKVYTKKSFHLFAENG